MMTDNTFLPSDTGDALQEVKDALYQRLADARQAAEVKFPLADEFELGINCRLDNRFFFSVLFLFAVFFVSQSTQQTEANQSKKFEKWNIQN